MQIKNVFSKNKFVRKINGFKTLVKKRKSHISYRNNTYYRMLHGRSTKHVLELVQTKYEPNPSIIQDVRCIQPSNPVFSTLTTDFNYAGRTKLLHDSATTITLPLSL